MAVRTGVFRGLFFFVFTPSFLGQRAFETGIQRLSQSPREVQIKIVVCHR
ncbi:uncharacterized protein STEHIDRAFT_163319 [Stereum hirsutum FP-91666 SS1]|uniref:Uncharacterized protein n=1 Tax=Stereum hirsutum (strain FP-91666) TaxID=721885 RepID=R7RXY7_STEHR|nr:uncharacterized protein STEHIDRAFT_163319 [Stereum hirsutum FP-91666 SS1]EIM79760.1 hypothetical protein STEHIDRAFT_163319 [Stereum hirsutum FP-91666 SS1]